jgi:hypothetical protein
MSGLGSFLKALSEHKCTSMLSFLNERVKRWRIDRRFPIRWLTYRARVQRDVEAAFKLPNGKEIFDYNYVEGVTNAIKQLEDWQVKCMSVSFAISAFLIIGFITDNASVSLFGVSLKQVAGLKEVLLAFSATIGVVLLMLTQSKEALIAVLAKLAELSTDKVVLPVVSLATRSSFHFKPYLPRQYDEWIFPTIFTKLLSLLTNVLVVGVVLFVFAGSLGLTLLLGFQIYRHPTLGIWSTVILYYVGAVFLLSIVATIRLNLPMPYRDKSDLKKMAELKKTDPAGYRVLQKKYFG